VSVIVSKPTDYIFIKLYGIVGHRSGVKSHEHGMRSWEAYRAPTLPYSDKIQRSNTLWRRGNVLIIATCCKSHSGILSGQHDPRRGRGGGKRT